MLLKKWMVIFSLCVLITSEIWGNERDQTITSILQELTDDKLDDIHIHCLEGGLTNENYQVSLGSNCYFFRFGHDANSALGYSLKREWQITSLVSEYGICPKVIYFSPLDDVLVTDFIRTSGGKVNLRDPSTLQQFCRQISILHHLEIEFPTQFDPYLYIEKSFKKALELDADLPTAFHQTILPAIKDFQLQEGRLQIDKTPAHLDLHAGNVLDDGDKLWLIDWEYAAMADQFFDLATLASVENFSDSEMNNSLKCYLERSPKDEEIEHFYQMRILADTRWALWSFIQAKISPLSEPFEEDGYKYLRHALERL